MKGVYKQYSEPGNEQYIITVRWPVYIEMRIEAPTEEKAVELVDTHLRADDFNHREHAVTFHCDPPGEALHDMQALVWDEHVEIVEVEQDSPPTTCDGVLFLGGE